MSDAKARGSRAQAVFEGNSTMRFLEMFLDDGLRDWGSFNERRPIFRLHDISVPRGFVITGWLLALVPVAVAIVLLAVGGPPPH